MPTPNPPTLTTATVYLLHRWSPDIDSTTLHTSYPAALNTLANYCRANWSDITSLAGVPDTSRGLDDTDVVSTYYGRVEGPGIPAAHARGQRGGCGFEITAEPVGGPTTGDRRCSACAPPSARSPRRHIEAGLRKIETALSEVVQSWIAATGQSLPTTGITATDEIDRGCGDHASSFERIIARQSHDPVKRNLEFACEVCDQHLCDIEPGDTLNVLLSTATAHCADRQTPR